MQFGLSFHRGEESAPPIAAGRDFLAQKDFVYSHPECRDSAFHKDPKQGSEILDNNCVCRGYISVSSKYIVRMTKWDFQ